MRRTAQPARPSARLADRLATHLATLLLAALPAVALAPAARAEAELAPNLFANTLQLSFQNNADYGAGLREDAFLYTHSFQSLVPLRLGPDWSLVVRTILPWAHQERLYRDHVSGFGDIVQNVFLTPNHSVRGATFGVGLAALYPSATDRRLSFGEWALGPAFYAGWQGGPLSLTLLTNHYFGVATHGEDRTRRPGAALNGAYIQPGIALSLGGGRTLFSQAEIIHDFDGRRSSMPVVAGANQAFQLGGQLMSLGVSGKYYHDPLPYGPRWGFRVALNFLLPR